MGWGNRGFPLYIEISSFWGEGALDKVVDMVDMYIS